ncbi:hypothetical protein H6F73_14135 [Microcoleus sp. FACHB-68]|nr:hypothetical protein [Microcoleus sp. FACHB-68]
MREGVLLYTLSTFLNFLAVSEIGSAERSGRLFGVSDEKYWHKLQINLKWVTAREVDDWFFCAQL